MSDSAFLEDLERDFVSYLSFLVNNHWVAPTMEFEDDIDEEEEGEQQQKEEDVRMEDQETDTNKLTLLGGGEKFLSTSETFECIEQDNKLLLFLRDSHARLITHGVCRYYGLKSESFNDVKSGKRGTRVFLAPSCLRVPDVPRMTLKEFIVEGDY